MGESTIRGELAHEWVTRSKGVELTEMQRKLVQVCVHGKDTGPWNIWPKSININDCNGVADVTMDALTPRTLRRMMEAADALDIEIGVQQAGFRLRVYAQRKWKAP